MNGDETLYDCLQVYLGFGFDCSDDEVKETYNLCHKIKALPASWAGNQYIVYSFSSSIPPVEIAPRVRAGTFSLLLAECWKAGVFGEGEGEEGVDYELTEEGQRVYWDGDKDGDNDIYVD